MIGLLLLLMMTVALSGSAYANNKYASLVMDADTGIIIHQSNADKMLHPASLTKVMTLLMLFDALDKNAIKLTDQIPISRNAASMVPSKLNLPAGSSIMVKDAIYALVTKSANDIAVAVAEKLGKTETRFAGMMTKKARDLGMNRTQFINASGLHHPKQVTTARDMAKMGRYLIAIQPKYYPYFSTRQFTYRGKKYNNHNHLMKDYEGMDGIKTGYVQASGFNLLASAKRNNRRLIGVVFGGRSTKTRNEHMRKLLDEGFKKYTDVRNASIILPVRNPRRHEVDMASQNTTTALNTTQLTQQLLDNPDKNLTQKSSEITAQERRLLRYKEDSYLAAGLQNTAQTKSIRSSLKSDDAIHRWGIQVGAFTDRAATDIILDRAYKKLPSALQYGKTMVAPAELKKGRIYRAWLVGFSQQDAKKACTFFKECLVIQTQS